MTQKKTNHRLIWFGWVLLFTHAIGLAVCCVLWSLDLIRSQLTDQITNVLSWEASILTAVGILLTALTKRDVDTT